MLRLLWNLSVRCDTVLLFGFALAFSSNFGRACGEREHACLSVCVCLLRMNPLQIRIALFGFFGYAGARCSGTIGKNIYRIEPEIRLDCIASQMKSKNRLTWTRETNEENKKWIETKRIRRLNCANNQILSRLTAVALEAKILLLHQKERGVRKKLTLVFAGLALKFSHFHTLWNRHESTVILWCSVLITKANE